MATSSSGMKYRTLGKTGYNISEISYGAWAIGGAWVSYGYKLRGVESLTLMFDRAP